MSAIRGFKIGDNVYKYEDTNIAEEFNNEKTYKNGDYVINFNDGCLYKYINSEPSSGNWNSANWEKSTLLEEIEAETAAREATDAALTEELNTVKSALAPEFSTETDYRVNHYVMYNGKIYRFKKDHPAGAWVSGDVEVATAASAWRDLTPLALA